MTHALARGSLEAAASLVVDECRHKVNHHFQGLPPLTPETVKLVAIHYLRVPRDCLARAIADVAIRQPGENCSPRGPAGSSCGPNGADGSR